MITRRTFFRLSALTAASAQTGSLLSQSSLLSQGSTPVVVETPLGRLVGEGRGAVNCFRGVPFAQPPVGPLRFRPPQPATPWKGVRQATTFAGAAPQAGGNAASHTEDCLYLNVWAPSAPGSYPVFVWVHGGGFTGGEAFDPLFDGTGFAERGILVVTVAYRLGVLGFLDMEPLLGASYAGSANNALKDLVAALGWIHENISAFGGDPAQVTLGGESAGAKLTDLLMGVPAAKPFFHQMISESGGAERIASKEESLKVGQGFAAAWKAQMGTPASAVLTATAEQLIGVQEQFTRDWPKHFPLRPEIDGSFIPQAPLEAIKAGASRGKRLLLGTNRDESALFIGPDPAKDPTARDVGNLPIAQFQTIEEAYSKLYPEMAAPLRRIRSLSAEEYLVPSVRVLEAHLTAGGEGFAYRFDFPGEGRFAGLAFHSYELRFVWEHFGKAVPSDTVRQLAVSMHTAWASFLRGSTPAGPGLPAWPPYTLQAQKTMILDVPSHVEAHPEEAELALWKGLLNS
ncbi:MAG: carboxylesterase/lipase family protein [Janthinobacterium lividum]